MSNSAFSIARVATRAIAIASIAIAGCSMHGIALGGAAAPATTLTKAQDPDVPKHIVTMDWLGGSSGTRAVTWAQAAPHTTWAFTGAKDSVAIRAAGIETLYYTQPNRQAPGDPEYTTENSTFSHDCGGSRIVSTNFPSENLMDPGSAELGQLWRAEVRTVTKSWGGVFNAIFEDLSDTIVYTSAPPCNFDQTTWSTRSNKLVTYVTGMGYPVFYNGLAVLSKNTDGTLGVSPTMALNENAAGGMFEGCYVTSGAYPLLHLNTWIATEETEIAMAAAGKYFLCEGLDDNLAAASIPARIYYYASLLMTYDPATTIDISEFSTPRDFHVLPETRFVPEDPLIAVTSTSQLVQSGDVYGRQYAHCYLGQVDQGACAVVVNIGLSKAGAFPWPGLYTRTLVPTGNDVYDGGSVSIQKVAPSSTMPALSAVIAVH
ncbi:MAG TPA: hypothetical protein VEJ20_03265 [Candidatus Eremiobacteraceae bacterium]|nr:hypothetical protein [Candidatus Eremiobacteraceae bacterium]